jgi:hypothetical protein
MNTPDLLAERGLFAFDRLALAELTHGFDELGAGGDTMPELICLSAAELSLGRLFPYQEKLLPLERPLHVHGDDALVAFLKTNCNILCMGSEGELDLADVTSFSGDVSKLALAGISEPPDPADAIGAFARAADELERLHVESPSVRAQALAVSGVLRLQTFLWAVKSAMVEVPLESAIADAFEAFELSQPHSVGVGAPA